MRGRKTGLKGMSEREGRQGSVQQPFTKSGGGGAKVNEGMDKSTGVCYAGDNQFLTLILELV